jgi:hypothetical protein
MLYREIIALCTQIHTKHINTLCGQNILLFKVKLTVHIVTDGIYMFKSLIKTCQLTLLREIIPFCSQIHTKHIITQCGQNVRLLNVKLVVRIVTTGLFLSSTLLMQLNNCCK